MRGAPSFAFVTAIFVSTNALAVGGNGRLSVVVSCPPALAKIQTTTGLSVGADFSKSINKYGIQNIGSVGNGSIPGSSFEQINQATDEIEPIGVPHATTAWALDIQKPELDTYKLHLMAVADGLADISISRGVADRKNSGDYKIRELRFVEKGKEYVLSLDGITSMKKLTVKNQSGPFLSLSESVVLACKLKEVGNKEGCETLEKIAKSAQNALAKGREKDALKKLKLFVKVLDFMHKNKIRHEVRFEDRDGEDHDCRDIWKKSRIVFAKDPSYSALRAMASNLIEKAK